MHLRYWSTAADVADNSALLTRCNFFLPEPGLVIILHGWLEGMPENMPTPEKIPLILNKQINRET